MKSLLCTAPPGSTTSMQMGGGKLLLAELTCSVFSDGISKFVISFTAAICITCVRQQGHLWGVSQTALSQSAMW